jgi:hypothetical protein
MAGIIQEQHPDRCALFMQWKQMDWPILVDSLNLLGVSAVPITLAIDEHGIIRHKGLRLNEADQIREMFVDRTYKPPEAVVSESGAPPASPDLERLRSQAETATGARRYANALVTWAGPEQLGEAVDVYRRALSLEPGDGPTHFRLGVAYRKRYDSEFREPDDFSQAVVQWKTALDLDPNQYIWRRRIQQYGPRLDKPYPFYDWVVAARQQIEKRGETLLPLSVEPGGAEFAEPLKSFETAALRTTEPDPQGRIHRDEKDFIRVETTVVPPIVQPGEAARVHLVFRPNADIKAHWNNEVDDLELWVNPPGDWQVDRRSVTTPNPRQAVSHENRKLEFEVRCPEDAGAEPARLSAHALYYVCEDVDGTCLYRRQDIELEIEVSQGLRP